MIDVIRWKHELQQKKAELRDVMTYLRTNPSLTIDQEQQMNDRIDQLNREIAELHVSIREAGIHGKHER